MSQISTNQGDFEVERPPHGGSRGYGPWVIVFGAVGLVLIPMIWGYYPREIARWHDAAAYEKYLEGDLPGAISQLDAAFTWHDKSAARYKWRGEYRRDLQDYEASLADFNTALELAPGDVAFTLDRATTLQHLGRHEEAVNDYKALMQRVAAAGERGLISRPSMQNGLAYARAVGNLELAEGMAGAEEVVALMGGDTYVLEQAGYLHVLRKDWPRAVARLSEAEKRLTESLAALKSEYEQAKDKRSQELVQSQGAPFEKRLSGVQHHLAKAYRQLEQPSEAEKYEKLALMWGEPERAQRRKLPTLELAWFRAGDFSAFLDTRGYLHYRLGNLIEARHDLELAVELGELEYRRPNKFHSYREAVEDLRVYRRHEGEMTRKVAVILYHRALVYERLGFDKLADEDLRRVREEFGCEPDEHLF